MEKLDLPHRSRFGGQSVAWGAIGEGDPLVMIHGTPFSSQVWRNIAPHLAATRKVYYFDLLGYGHSDKHEGQDVSLKVQNRVLAHLLAEWGVETPSVICHDFGATTALRGHYVEGLRYRDITIFDAVALAPWGSPFVAHVRRYEAAFAGIPAYVQDALLAAYLQSAAHKTLRPEVIDLYSAPWRGLVGQPAFYRQIAQMDIGYTDEIEPRYGPLGCPTQILWGAHDGWIPVPLGERLANLLTGGRITIVPGAGHLLQEDAPEAVVAAMLNPKW
ncbi:alpha/beta fold hydrolase [Prosthecomicrobium sp. N25]|uniref:alpha/beta fold hydrolase n=1 Tax=Prosthecomicrobium sp. N25 TaxID=3129254 RepID=UPI003078115E